MTSQSPSFGTSGATDAVDTYNPSLLAQRIILPEGCPRHLAVASLSARIQSNEYGLPMFFIRSDMLPFDLGTLTQTDVDNASEGLFYNEGYPTLQNGTTFWHQLPHEPYDAYILFTRYIEQAEDLGIRQLDLLAVSTHSELPEVQALYNEYYWSARARAHDIFIVAAEQKKRFHRTRKTENKHFDVAGRLLDTLLQKFNDDEWFEELNAKEALEALELLVKIQRLSLGLTGQHASSTPKDKLPDGASTESIMRSITRGAGLSQDSQDGFMGRLKALMDNPEEGMVIQEAILRLGKSDVPSNTEAM